jgi:LysM repeat protein
MKRESIIFFFLFLNFVSLSQVDIDSTTPLIEPTDTSVAIQKLSIVIPPFILINSDTIKLGEFDELVCDSYCAAAVPAVYDALHSFHSRRVDKFGGYINHKVNIGLENIRKKGFNSDVKRLYIQINPKTLTVYWIAVVGPSTDGRCYVRFDSRGSAGGGYAAVQPQVKSMHRLYPSLSAEKLLEFTDSVVQCFEWNGNSLPFYYNTVNISQHFYKYYDAQIGSEISLEVYTKLFPVSNEGSYAPVTNLPRNNNSAPSKYRKYKVKAGDSLGKIALKYHTTVSKIKKANGLRSDMIRIGQVLKIP